MRVAEVNMVDNGSTGRIMQGIAMYARLAGHDVRTFSPYVYQRKSRMEVQSIKGHDYFGYLKENMLHLALSQATGFHGCFSNFGTIQLLKKLDEFQPDIIHLHNLHNMSINVPMLFSFIKRNHIKTVWTLHDCWSMTGRCAYFDLVGCSKWKTGCHHCPLPANFYPKSYVDQTRLMWKLRKKWFTGVENMTIVTPSQWLANIVRQSYLQDYPIKVINNGIDLNIFKPTPSDFRSKHNIIGKFIVLGVAFDWGKRKGLDVFIELAKRLDDRFQIILVGTNENIDRGIPGKIITIHQTQNQRELAEIYTTADVFANPTREENYPTVNMEAIACGTPVVTFRTGGSPEIPDANTGAVVDCDDIDALECKIIDVCVNQTYTEETCIRRASRFNARERYREYNELYVDMICDSKKYGESI